MKVLVPVKRVVDYNVKVRVKADQSGVDTTNVKMSMNPFDEIALEQAVQLKENNIASEIIIVSIGGNAVQDTLRTGLAMGADRAIAVTFDKYDQDGLEPLAVAKILAKIAQEEKPDLILCGKQAIDDDYGATGQMLAGILGWSQAMFASSVKIDGGVATVTREIDQGLQDIAVDLPAVISADLRLNEPRYPSLPNIMKAKKKPIDVRDITDFAFDPAPRLQIVSVTEPKGRVGGTMLESVEQLIEKIQEAGVIR